MIKLRWMLFRHDVGRRWENTLSWVGRHLPSRLRYQTWIDVTAEATTDAELMGQEVPGIHLDDLLRVTHRRLAA